MPGMKLYVAGYNHVGQCGVDPETAGKNILTPSPVGLEALEGAAVEMIAMGCGFTLLLARRRVYHAGYGRIRGNGTTGEHAVFAAVPLPQAAEVVEIACGYSVALALLAGGTALSWGGSSIGRGGDRFTPLPVEGLRDVMHLYAGGRFAFALLTSGEVFAWGRNDYGQLCLGRTGDKSTPQRVAALCGKAQTLALSNTAGIALCSDGSALAWGKLNGSMADGSATWAAEGGCLPIRIDCGGTVSAVAAGYSHFSVICGDQLVSWGDACFGRLGRDGPAERPAPCPFPGGGKVSIVICTKYCTLAKAGEQWAICGAGGYGPPFGSSAEVPDLTPVPDPWVPFPKQVGCMSTCIFYTCGELPEESTNGAAADAAPGSAAGQCDDPARQVPAGPAGPALRPSRSAAVAVEGLKADLAAAEAALAAEQARNQELQRALAAAGPTQVAELKGLLAVLSEDLAKAEAAAAPPSAAVARYYRRYADSIDARTPSQVAAFLWNLLLMCAEIPGAGPESEFAAMHQRLVNDVDKRVETDRAKGVDYGRPEAEVRVALIWSTGPAGCATYRGEPLEFSAWINLILVHRDSDRPLKLALPFVRTLNRFCVTATRGGDGDAAPGGRWAGKEMDAVWGEIGRNDWNVYRGSSMAVEHKSWFVPGLVFRQPRYVATSLSLGQAELFARERTMDGRIPVVWVVKIDQERKCCHVNCLGSRYSMFREESELLFPPYSVFTVVAVDWAAPGSGRTSRITIEAAPDNKEYPLDLPEAPWS